MKRKDKEKEQSLKNADDNSTEQKRKDEFKIEIIKVGKLVQNTEQDNYDMTPPPSPEPSDRNIKENFAQVNRNRILDSLLTLSVETWNYKNQSTDIRHIGPMAQDFAGAFGVGEDDKHINMIDAFGVTLASIQALNEKIEQRDAKIRDLEKKIDELTCSAS
jgi:hypothetical protein